MQWLPTFSTIILALTCILLAERARRDAAKARAQADSLKKEIKRLQKDIDSESTRLGTITGSMTEGLLVVDPSHVIRYANEACQLFFRMPGNPTGKTILEGTRESAIKHLVTETWQSGTAQREEISLLRPGNKTIHLEVNAVPTKDSAALVLVFHDITERRKLEEVRREFVGNVSHELRTPLAIFQGYVETMLEEPDMELEQRGEMLHALLRHSRRLNAIVEDLLTLARLETPNAELETASLDLREFLERQVVDWRRLAGQKGVELICEVADSIPEIQADSFRLEQAVSNLVANALKYTPAGGTIRLHASQSNGEARIDVEDTGTGIPPNALPHIFERFYRVERARSRDAGGTGLGLAIVKHIIMLHGGTVEAASTYGQGTTISMRLPAGLAKASQS